MSWKIIECPKCGNKTFNFIKINKDGTALLECKICLTKWTTD